MVINHMNKMTIKEPPPASAPPKKNAAGEIAAANRSRSRSQTQIQRPSALKIPDAPSKTPSVTSTTGGTATEAQSGRKVTSKKMYCIVLLSVYIVICLIGFMIDFGIWLFALTRKMHYFIVFYPEKRQYLDVVPDAFWVFMKFFIGCLAHFTLAIFTLLVLMGMKSLERLVVKYQERVLLWVTIMACIAEYFMCSGVIDYVGSTATVTNGEYQDTINPPVVIPGCSTYGGNVPDLRSNYIRVNLKWMREVSCEYGMIRLRRGMFTRVKACQMRMEDLAKRDCNITALLHHVILSMIMMDCLGVLFCCGVFYLYCRSVVRTSPGRFSFVESTYEGDVEAMREVANRVRKYASGSRNASKHITLPKEDPKPAMTTTPE